MIGRGHRRSLIGFDTMLLQRAAGVVLSKIDRGDCAVGAGRQRAKRMVRVSAFDPSRLRHDDEVVAAYPSALERSGCRIGNTSFVLGMTT